MRVRTRDLVSLSCDHAEHIAVYAAALQQLQRVHDRAVSGAAGGIRALRIVDEGGTVAAHAHQEAAALQDVQQLRRYVQSFVCIALLTFRLGLA